MTIPFNQVSQAYRASKVFIELAGVQRSLASLFIPPTVLMPGMYDPLKTTLVDYKPLLVISADDVGKKAGFGSHAHRQALRIPSAVYAQGGGVWWVPIPEEGAGVLAAEDVTFTGTTATSSGTFFFSIGGDVIQIGVIIGDTPTLISSKLTTEITAKQNLAVTGLSAIGVTTATSKFKGTQGNQILIKINPSGDVQENLNPEGITVALSEVDGYLAGGATDPDLTDMFFDGSGDDILGDRWYTHITMPFTDSTNVGIYKSWLDKRESADTNRRCFSFAAYYSEDYAGALALPATFNNKSMVQVWDDRIEYPAFEVAAELAGIAADEEGQSPNRPIKTLELSGPADTTVVNRRDALNDALFRAGMSYLVIDSSGQLRLGDIALTYRTNDSNGATEEWFDLVQGQGRQAKAYSLNELFLADKYSRGVVVDNDAVTGVSYAIAPKDVVSDLFKLLDDLWGPFAWSKNIKEIKKTISAEINSGNNSRIDGTLTDDESRALRIVAIRYAYLY